MHLVCSNYYCGALMMIFYYFPYSFIFYYFKLFYENVCPLSSTCLFQNQQTFCAVDQIAIILVFVGHTVSVIQLSILRA